MVCPLCNSVVNSDITMDKSMSHIYPDAETSIKRLRFFIRLMIFVSFLAETILVLINYLTYNGVKWSLVCGAGLIYANVIIWYTFKKNVNHRTKIFVEGLGVVALTIVLDIILGYSGWSLDYAVPITLLALDGIIIVLMMINSMGWLNYIIYHVLIVLFGIILDVLALCKVVKHPLLSLILTAVSVVILVGILLFGDKKVSNEISRKFKV